jgi:uncharacterized protein YdiU (UPF0061 family)
MQRAEVDMTEFFRALADIKQDTPELTVLENAFYSTTLYRNHQQLLEDWLTRYAARLLLQEDSDTARRNRMNLVNPRFILRNYLSQQAIDAAMNGDMTVLERLMDAARHPYNEDIPADLIAKRPDWAINKPGCSTLSCSS